MNKKVVFMGTPVFSVPILEALIENTDVIGVVTQPDKLVGRDSRLSFSPVKEVALKYNIKVFQPVKIRNEFQEILDLNPDIIITCAYGQIIPKEILEYPEYGCINVHASLLPKLRGGAPIHHAIIDGYDKTGITIMYMNEKMDEGDIISKKETVIEDTDTTETLHDRLSLMGKDLLIETLPSIFNKTNQRIKQDNSDATYGFNIKREDELINFDKTSREIFNQVRGLYSWPGAYTTLEGKIIKVWKVTINNQKFDKEPGTIVELSKKGIIVATADSSVILNIIQPEGKGKMEAYSYINGLQNKDELIDKRFVWTN